MSDWDEEINIRETTYTAPSFAHRARAVYDMGADDEGPLEEYMYRTYTFLGRVPNGVNVTRSVAQAVARDKFGPSAKVFQTARYWVAYRLD